MSRRHKIADKYSGQGMPILGPAQVRLRHADGAVLWDGAPSDLNDELEILRRRVAQLTAAVESVDDAIIGEDLLGLVTSWNRGAERMYGYTSSEMLGRPLDILLPTDRRGEIEQLDAEIRRGNTIEGFSTQRLNRTGRLVDVSLTMSAIRDGSGQVIGISSIARDVTKHKQPDGQFAQVQSLDAMGRLVGSIAHDFNNLLGIIGGNQELLRGSVLLHPNLKRWTDEIGKATKQAAVLTRQLLALGQDEP